MGKLADRVAARDGWDCHYCHVRLDSSSATVDHVVPRTANGSSGLRNLVLACWPCNQEKGAESYETFTGQPRPAFRKRVNPAPPRVQNMPLRVVRNLSISRPRWVDT